MSANEVKINGSKDYTWVVSDSKMEELIEWLYKHGEHTSELDEMPVAYGTVAYAEDGELKDTGMTVPVFVGNVLLNIVQTLNKKLVLQDYVDAWFGVNTNMVDTFAITFCARGLDVVLWDEVSFTSWNQSQKEPLDIFLSGLANKALRNVAKQAALVEL